MTRTGERRICSLTRYDLTSIVVLLSACNTFVTDPVKPVPIEGLPIEPKAVFAYSVYSDRPAVRHKRLYRYPESTLTNTQTLRLTVSQVGQVSIYFGYQSLASVIGPDSETQARFVDLAGKVTSTT